MKLNLEIVKALERECLAPVFVYMYDPAWALLRQIWPAVEATLGGPCVMEPSFAAFRLNFRKASTGGACVFVDPPPPLPLAVSCEIQCRHLILVCPGGVLNIPARSGDVSKAIQTILLWRIGVEMELAVLRRAWQARRACMGVWG